MVDRYRDYQDRLDLVICGECSDRTMLYLIPREEMAEHDAWHDAADLDDRETARVLGQLGARVEGSEG